jgi:signal transduction histidine kinase/ActR/RegA family two-component response regulator
LEKLGILIIEGKGGIARALMVSRPGFKIIHAERMAKAEALAAPALASGGFAAILVDLALADCQDEEAHRRAAALLPGTPIVALLRKSDPALAETLIQAGAQACLEHEGLDGGALASAIRQAVLRRRAETRRFRSLFDAAPMGILLAAGRRVLMANTAAQELLGYDEAGFASLSILAPFPPAARPLLEGALDAPAPPDARFTADLARLEGASVRCRVHVAAAVLNDAPVIALFLTPLAEAADGDAKAGGAQAAPPGAPALQVRKMEALGRFAGGVAHDFGNLLTAINGYSEHLLNQAGDAGPLAGGLRSILRAGESAADLARQLAGMTQSDGGEPVPVAVDAALLELEPILQRTLGPGIDLRLEPRAGDATVTLEPGRLERILMTLCSNARDAMPEGGILRVATEALEIVPETVFTHLAAGPGSAVAITVEDEGIGMGPEALERLFEPFYSTKRGGRGRGMALATVFGMVERGGGGISVESIPGKGSRFRIALPRGEPVAAPERALGTQSDKGSVARSAWARAGKGGGTILVAEDEPSLREMIQAILALAGFTVITANSSDEAAEVFAAREDVDLLVTDVMLRGGEGGDELAAQLQARRPGLRALFISGHPLEILADRGIRLPAEAFLEKPFTPSQLIAQVRALLNVARETH